MLLYFCDFMFAQIPHLTILFRFKLRGQKHIYSKRIKSTKKMPVGRIWPRSGRVRQTGAYAAQQAASEANRYAGSLAPSLPSSSTRRERTRRSSEQAGTAGSPRVLYGGKEGRRCRRRRWGARGWPQILPTPPGFMAAMVASFSGRGRTRPPRAPK